jgi:hypothetical protein
LFPSDIGSSNARVQPCPPRAPIKS